MTYAQLTTALWVIATALGVGTILMFAVLIYEVVRETLDRHVDDLDRQFREIITRNWTEDEQV